jgi:WhiB family redox-sensing transcriptional regulator
MTARRSAIEWSPGAVGPVLRLIDEEPYEGPDGEPGNWRDLALCAEVDGELWFPEKGGSTREAKAVCSRCRVAGECLEYAMDVESRPWVDYRYGVYGGLAPKARARLQRERDRQAVAA